MLSSTEQILDAGYGARVFDERDLARIYGGSAARRYGLANKAMKKGELVRLSRGTYCLGSRYRTAEISKYYAASRVAPWSVVSLHSALSFHGWIPERVEGVTSVTDGKRETIYETPLGPLRYTPVPVRPYSWLRRTSRHETRGQPFLMAEPLRALADYVYVSRTEWSGLDEVVEGLRIDSDELEALDRDDFDEVRSIYRSRRVVTFLEQLQAALGR